MNQLDEDFPEDDDDFSQEFETRMPIRQTPPATRSVQNKQQLQTQNQIPKQKQQLQQQIQNSNFNQRRSINQEEFESKIPIRQTPPATNSIQIKQQPGNQIPKRQLRIQVDEDEMLDEISIPTRPIQNKQLNIPIRQTPEREEIDDEVIPNKQPPTHPIQNNPQQQLPSIPKRNENQFPIRQAPIPTRSPQNQQQPQATTRIQEPQQIPKQMQPTPNQEELEGKIPNRQPPTRIQEQGQSHSLKLNHTQPITTTNIEQFPNPQQTPPTRIPSRTIQQQQIPQNTQEGESEDQIPIRHQPPPTSFQNQVSNFNQFPQQRFPNIIGREQIEIQIPMRQNQQQQPPSTQISIQPPFIPSHSNYNQQQRFPNNGDNLNMQIPMRIPIQRQFQQQTPFQPNPNYQQPQNQFHPNLNSNNQFPNFHNQTPNFNTQHQPQNQFQANFTQFSPQPQRFPNRNELSIQFPMRQQQHHQFPQIQNHNNGQVSNQMPVRIQNSHSMNPPNVGRNFDSDSFKNPR